LAKLHRFTATDKCLYSNETLQPKEVIQVLLFCRKLELILMLAQNFVINFSNLNFPSLSLAF